MKAESIKEQHWTRWSLIFLGWTCLGLFFISRNVVLALSRGRTPDWVQGILFEMIFWQLWALMTPLIFSFLRRWRIDWQHRWRGVLGLLLFGLVVALFHTAVDYGIGLSLAWAVLHRPPDEIARV